MTDYKDDEEDVNVTSSSKLIKVLPIGIGQGGGKLARALGIGFDSASSCVYFNSSAMDLAGMKLNADEFKRYIKIGNQNTIEGAGKDRSVGDELLKKEKTSIINQLVSYAEEDSYDFIFIVFSTAGGTGSGMGPKIAALMNANDIINRIVEKTGKRPIVFGVGALPEITSAEGTLSYQNTLECLEEIKKFIGITRFLLINNSSTSAKSKGRSRIEQLQEINTTTVDIIKRYFTKYGIGPSTLDRADRYGALNVMGIHAFEILGPDGSRQVTPFYFPDGERVKRCCYEVPVKMENMALKAIASSGAICDDTIHGLYTEDSAENAGLLPIIAYHGYSNVAKIAEAYDKRLKLIRENAERIENDNVYAATGLDDVKAEREERDRQYGNHGANSVDDIFA